jgi:hypothetical protein
MKWVDKPCPRCGGDLYADYAGVALVCLECGHHEAPPKLCGIPAEPAAKRSSSATQAPEHVVALIEVRPRSRPLIERVCASHGCGVVCWPSSTLSAGEPSLTAAELLIVEADRGGLAVALARRLRLQAPAVPIALILTCWSESEPEARSTAEFVIHAPLREREVNGVLQVVESYGGWLPSPLLGAAYRAGVPGTLARVVSQARTRSLRPAPDSVATR